MLSLVAAGCTSVGHNVASACFPRMTWRQRGNQGTEWHVGQASLSATKNWLLQFTATVGSGGNQGDIAIDDVAIEVLRLC